ETFPGDRPRKIAVRAALPVACVASMYNRYAACFGRLSMFVAGLLDDSLHCAVSLTRNPVAAALAVDGGLADPLDGGVSHRLCDRVGVEVVARGLGEQEDILMAFGAAVPYAFRDGVRFGPDDVLTQVPPVCLQGKCDPPGHTDKVLLLKSRHGRSPAIFFAYTPANILVLERSAASASSTGGIRVPQIQPQNPVILQHAPYLTEQIGRAHV